MGGHLEAESILPYNVFLYSRFAHSDVLKWYIVLLADFSSNTVQLNHCITKMFHRISYDLKMAPILYQARLFRTFQKLLNTPGFAKQPGANVSCFFMTPDVPELCVRLFRN